MGHGMRRGLSRAIPWLALVLVSVFAFTQVRARFDTRSELAKTRDELNRHRMMETDRRTTATSPDGVTPRERALDAALGAEREAHTATTKRLAAVEEALRAERVRADRTEALRVTEAARADAAARRLAEFEAERDRLNDELATDQGERDPVARWLADAASGKKARIEYAQACAKDATSEQVDQLRDLLAEDAKNAPALVRLAAALPASDDAADLAADLVLACREGEPVRDRLEALGEAHLLRLDALGRILEEGRIDVCRAAVAWAAARWAKLAEKDQQGLAGLLGKQLASSDPEVAAVGAHGVALAGLADFGPKLVPLLRSISPDARAAAAHALSRAPDLDASAGQVRPHLLRLLADEELRVRTAATLLARQVLGEPIDFDPAASAAERAKALERLRARLGG